MASALESKHQEMSSAALQSLGQRYYRKKRYKDALKAFNAALKVDDKQRYAILDNRAATYEKLGDFPAALRDAKAMIQQERTTAKGYLRAGKILQLMEKREKALDMYSYGLRHTAPTDADLPVLFKVHDAAARADRAHVRIDPVSCLPFEILQMVMQQISFRDMLKALRVSRAWWHYISSNPALWAELEVCNDRGGRYKLVRPKTIQTYIQRAQNRVRRATLSILGVETAAECLMLIVRECPLLEYLEIRFRVTHEQLLAAVEATRRLKTLIITAPCELLAGDIEKVLMCCPTLAHMEVRSITCIDSSTPSSKMVLYYLTHVRFGSLGSPLWSFPLSFSAPNLRKLSLISHWFLEPLCASMLTVFPKLEHVELQACNLYAFPALPPSVRFVCFESSTLQDRPWAMHAEPGYVVDLPNLEVLGANWSNVVTPELLRHILKSSGGKLRKLELCQSPGDYRAALIHASEQGQLANLTELTAAHMPIDDKTVEALARGSPVLEHVHLGSTQVTGVSVKALLARPWSKIQSLKLNNCSSVSVDAVEYARAKGVEVLYFFPDTLKGGRRVRYG